jgi:MurNAc alpha-1-phosphate uridylyltransferase
MVPAPSWAPHGDFDLAAGAAEAGRRGRLTLAEDARLTYAGLGVFAPAFFAGMTPGHRPLRPLLDAAIGAGRVTAEVHEGVWDDIGTLERLERARRRHGP